MNVDMFSFKELYDVYLKITYPIEVNGKTLEPGETIAKFDRIQIAALNQEKMKRQAQGGWDNRSHVFWESTTDVTFNFSEGVFSKTHFALLSNSKLLELEEGEEVAVTITENLESDENCELRLKFKPISKVFIYKKDTREKLTEVSLNGETVTLQEPFMDVIVEYQYGYTGGGQIMKIGRRLIAGYLELEAKTRIKDDTTGQVVTGLVKIPKLKLMSDLSIRLGMQANPVVANFSAVGVPVGQRGTSHVSEFYFLNNDIDSDM